MGAFLSSQLEGGGSRLSSVNAALTGGLSRALASTLLCPVTVVKTRMEYGGGDAIRCVLGLGNRPWCQLHFLPF